MKNTVKLIAALLIVFSTASATYASMDSASFASYCKVMPAEDEKRFNLIYNSVATENVTIQLLDEAQKVVYKEKMVETNGFVKSFDLSNMPEGTYIIKVTSDDYVYTQPVKVTSWKAEKMLMTVAETGRKYALVGQNDSKSDVTLFILDDNGNTLYKDVIKAGKEVQKVYNLEKVNTRNASFVLYGEKGLVKERIFEL